MGMPYNSRADVYRLMPEVDMKTLNCVLAENGMTLEFLITLRNNTPDVALELFTNEPSYRNATRLN